MAELVKLGEFMGAGEERVASCLRSELPKTWLVVASIQIVLPTGFPREIDFVVFGENKVFVIDEKSITGKIHGNEHHWLPSSGDVLQNPVARLEMTAKNVAGKLRRNVPGIPTAPFVHAVVVMSSSQVELLMQDPRRSQVVRLKDCVQYLRNQDDVEPHDGVGRCMADIKKSLHLFPPRPAVPSHIGSFSIQSELVPGKHFRQFLADHEAGGKNAKRRLKVYELDGLGPEEQSRQKNLIYRDFNALCEIGDTGLVTAVDLPFPWEDNRLIVVPHHRPVTPSLRNLLTSHYETVAITERLRIGIALLSGITEIHAHDVLHRNLSPDCVHLNGSAIGSGVVFSDFDFARLVNSPTIATSTADLTEETVYVAPEVRNGLQYASKASDVYSAGVMLAEILSGRPGTEIMSGPAPTLDLGALECLGLTLDEASWLDGLLINMTEQSTVKRLKSADEALTLLRDLVADCDTRIRTEKRTAGTRSL